MQQVLEKFARIAGTRYASSTCRGFHDRLGIFFRRLERIGKEYTEVTKADIEKLLLSSGTAQGYRLSMLFALRTFYDVVNAPSNPAAQVPRPRTSGRRLAQVPGKDALHQAIAKIAGVHPVALLRNRLMAELAYGSGLRRCELLSLNIEDANLSSRTAFIRGKGGTDRIVPLTGASVALFAEYLTLRKEACGPLLANVWTGRRLTINHITKTFRQRTGYNTHRFRHACATHMLQNGCGLRAIQTLLGHAKIDTTTIYTAIDKSNLRRVLAETHPRSETYHRKRQKELF
jgi:site-specific recombinase XerD